MCSFIGLYYITNTGKINVQVSEPFSLHQNERMALFNNMIVAIKLVCLSRAGVSGDIERESLSISPERLAGQERTGGPLSSGGKT